ncbi:MAG: ABC transporter ATP-binding protein [Promethearchaeota archaeon]|jgi:ABC-2 type transport system ATP-binding protein
MSEIVIKLENLTKRFGNFTAVDNIDLEVCRGETIGLVGPNGAGKTTTIKMIAKILRPNSGRILIRTNHSELLDLQNVSSTISQMGFLIDIPNFYNMTAYQLLKYFAKIQNYPKDKTEARINELLIRFKLTEWKHEKVKNFSKGMTQKLGIIQAIIHDPDIIILDEPQTGLDPLARIEIRKYIRDLQSQGKTIFVASHMLYEISEVCDKIALINYGKIIGFDTVENLAKSLKINVLNCILLKPLNTVRYKPEKQEFKFYFDGKSESRGEILKTLIKDFESDFTVVAFTQPKTSQLEMVYSQMVKNNKPEGKRKLNGDVS